MQHFPLMLKFQAQRDDVTVATMSSSFDLRAGNETDFLLIQDFTKREAKRNKNPSTELSFSGDFFCMIPQLSPQSECGFENTLFAQTGAIRRFQYHRLAEGFALFLWCLSLNFNLFNAVIIPLF